MRKTIVPIVVVLILVVIAGLAVTIAGCGTSATVSGAAGGTALSTATASTPAESQEAVAATPAAATLTASSQQAWTSPAEAVAARAGASVVNVRVTGVATSPFFGDQPYEGIGSGVVYSSDGYIITNEHVVTENGSLAESVEVTFSNGETAPAAIVATDPYTDIAVIKVDKTGLVAASFADESEVTVGEYAIAIGSPLDYSNSVTLGIVSGVDRSIENSGSTALVDLIQTDAAISPGSSGGALLDAGGRVIGINVAYIPPDTTGAENLGFAIPATTAVEIAKQLMTDGHADHAYVGASYVAVTLSLQERYRLSTDSGVLITAVDPQGPAAAAGLEQGDIITALQGKAVDSDTDVIAVVRELQAGDEISLTVDRDGQKMDLTVTLSERQTAGE